MDMSDDYVPPLGQRLGASLSFFVLTTIGTSIYVLLIIALIRGRKKIPNYVFFVFVYHFAVADIGLMAFTNYFVAIPLSSTGRPLYGNGLVLKLMSFSDSFFINAITFLSFIVSLHRFLVFFSPKWAEILFDRPKVYFVLIIPWISGLVVDSAFNFIGNCFKSYNHITFNFGYDCTANTTSMGLVLRELPTATDVMPVCSLILYIAVYLKMRHDHRAVLPSHRQALEMDKRKRERSFLIQALIICLSLAFEALLFHVVPFLAQKNVIDGYWVSLLLGWMIIIVASINPIIYLVFNQTVRELVFELLGIKKIITAQTTVNVASMLHSTRATEASAAPQ